MSQDAREKARQIAAKQSKRGNVAMNRRWIQLTVLGVVVVIVFVIQCLFSSSFGFYNNSSKTPVNIIFGTDIPSKPPAMSLS